MTRIIDPSLYGPTPFALADQPSATGYGIGQWPNYMTGENYRAPNVGGLGRPWSVEAGYGLPDVTDPGYHTGTDEAYQIMPGPVVPGYHAGTGEEAPTGSAPPQDVSVSGSPE